VPLADRSCDCSHRPGQTDTGSSSLFFFNATATTEIYTTTDTLSLLDALPISALARGAPARARRLRRARGRDRGERSEEHTSELQSPVVISYAVFCFKKKKGCWMGWGWWLCSGRSAHSGLYAAI